MIIGFLCLPAGIALAEGYHISHCLVECPAGSAPASEIVVRNLYAAAINSQTGLADWTAYRVLPTTIGVASLLPREWHEDSLSLRGVKGAGAAGGISLRQPVLENSQDQAYRLTEFSISAGDQGRLVPMSSFAGTSYWEDLNFLTVMSPLQAGMRTGAWARLDQAVNELAPTLGELYVVTGPVYSATGSTPGTLNPSPVPTAYFKVIADASGRTAAFLMDQELPPHAPYCEQLTSLAEIQGRSGLMLFPAIDGANLNDELALLLGCRQPE